MAVAFGLVPCLAAWAWQLVQSAIAASQQAAEGVNSISLINVIRNLSTNGVNPVGMIALSQVGNGSIVPQDYSREKGYLLTSIFLSSTMVHIIERQFLRASIWMLIAAFLSSIGVVHSFVIVDNVLQSQFGFFPGGWHGFALRYGSIYLGIAFLLFLFFIKEKDVSYAMIMEQLAKFVSDWKPRSPLLQRISPLLPRRNKKLATAVRNA